MEGNIVVEVLAAHAHYAAKKALDLYNTYIEKEIKASFGVDVDVDPETKNFWYKCSDAEVELLHRLYIMAKACERFDRFKLNEKLPNIFWLELGTFNNMDGPDQYTTIEQFLKEEKI